MTNDEHVFNIFFKKLFYEALLQMCLAVIGHVENNSHKKYDSRPFNNTNNIYRHINNYSNDVFNNCKINKLNNVKTTYSNFNDGITLNKTSNNYSSDTYNIKTYII